MVTVFITEGVVERVSERGESRGKKVVEGKLEGAVLAREQRECGEAGLTCFFFCAVGRYAAAAEGVSVMKMLSRSRRRSSSKSSSRRSNGSGSDEGWRVEPKGGLGGNNAYIGWCPAAGWLVCCLGGRMSNKCVNKGS